MSDPRPTDVLTFDLRDDPTECAIEGEIVISAETAARQALRFHATPAQELLRYVIHGTLHLSGYDDRRPGDRRRMRREENRVLAGLRPAAAICQRQARAKTASRPRRSTSSVRR
jgi:probable rRNA maturation factor